MSVPADSAAGIHGQLAQRSGPFALMGAAPLLAAVPSPLAANSPAHQVQEQVVDERRKIVLVGSKHGFARTGSDTWLAGHYADDVQTSRVTVSNADLLFGAFALVRHDRRAHSVTVLTDRFGHQPLFMARAAGPGGERLMLATDFASLAGDGALGIQDPDPGAISDIFAFNVPFDERTPSSRIRAIGGAVELVIDTDTLVTRSRRLWDPVALLADAELAFDDVKDELVRLFIEGVGLATAGHRPVSVTLSGGADSRCLLAACLQLGLPTAVYSTGVPGSRALAYAHGMAEQCHVQENPHPLDAGFMSRFPQLMQESNALVQGMSFSSELEALWLREHVPPAGVLLHGAFAELFKIGKMHNFHYDDSLRRLRGAALVDALWSRFAARYALRCSGLEPGQAVSMGELARVHLAETVRRHESRLDTAGVLQMIYLDEFLGKVAKSSAQVWRERLPTMFPFAYPPLVDLILRVRTADKIANRFVVHLLEKTNGILARYPDSNTGVRIGASRLQRELVHVVDYAARRIFRSRARADHQDFAHWLQRIQPGLEAVFDQLQQATGAYDMDRVHQLIGRCRSGEDLASRTLQFLWAWGLFKSQGAVARRAV